MAFDGFTLKAVVQELNSCLINGKITKVYQPTPEEIILGVYSNGGNYALACNISSLFYSLHLTTKSKPNPLSAPNFCMLLRKHLIGFRIKSISMIDLERLAIIELEGYNELNDLVTLKLIIELMGKHSNIILVNYNNIIIDSLKHFNTFSGSYRNILPGSSYQLPVFDRLSIPRIYSDFESHSVTTMEKLDLNLEMQSNLSNIYNDLIENKQELSLSSLFLDGFSGTSKSLLNYYISKLNITDECNFDNFKILLFNLVQLFKSIKSNMICCLDLGQDYIISKSDINSPCNVNFFLDDYYFEKENQEQFSQYRNSLLSFILKKLKKISKKLDAVNSKIQECSKIDEYKLYGELITSNLYKISENHTDNIILENYYNENKPIVIPLDISISPADNAKKYFKKYNKLKNTINIVTEQKEELEKEIDYLESIVYELQVAKSTSELNHIYQEMEDANLFSRRTQSKQGSKAFKVKSKSIGNKNYNKSQGKFSDFLSFKVEDFTVLVGKNNHENDYLSLKVAKPDDIWFHVKDMQGSHVILVLGQKEPSQEVINKVASITAYYSKARQSSNVPVDYTFAKYIKKPAKAKPGMVIYTNQKTVNVQPKNYG